MRSALPVLLVLVVCSCSGAPTMATTDPATRAAELAVRVANDTATEDEKVELDAYLKGKE